MIIEVEDKFGHEFFVDTETATREQLAETCHTLHRWWTHCSKLIDTRDKVLADHGLWLDEAADFRLRITDRETATAWFARALAWTDEADKDDEA